MPRVCPHCWPEGCKGWPGEGAWPFSISCGSKSTSSHGGNAPALSLALLYQVLAYRQYSQQRCSYVGKHGLYSLGCALCRALMSGISMVQGPGGLSWVSPGALHGAALCCGTAGGMLHHQHTQRAQKSQNQLSFFS